MRFCIGCGGEGIDIAVDQCRIVLFLRYYLQGIPSAPALYFFDAALHDDLAFVKQCHLVADMLDVREDVSGEDDGGLFLGCDQDIEDLLAAYRVQGRGGLVTDE